MLVVYDGSAFENIHQRGVQRVFRELLPRLGPDIARAMVFTNRVKSPPPSIRSIHALGPFRHLPRALRAAIAPGAARRAVRRALSTPGAIFHSTTFNLPPRLRLRRDHPRIPEAAPSVVHVHDMIPERCIDYFQGDWSEREIARKRRAIESAAAIIAISHATAAEIEYFYPAAKDRITVIHHGADHLGSAAPQAVENLPRLYALFVGDRALYKNFSVILDAMELSTWPGDVALVIAGPPLRANEALRLERARSRRQILFLGRVSDGQLASLYRAAACAVVPSVAEGFGLPLLEAQHAQTPVVCSDIAVFREVAGEGAIYFPPHAPGALAAAVESATRDDIRAALASGAAANLTRFSWDRAAAQLAEVYRSLVPT